MVFQATIEVKWICFAVSVVVVVAVVSAAALLLLFWGFPPRQAGGDAAAEEDDRYWDTGAGNADRPKFWQQSIRRMEIKCGNTTS